MFSAHDNTILALFSALGLVIEPSLPDYGAILAFEIYKNAHKTDDFLLKIAFEDQYLLLKSHQVASMCSVSHVLELMEQFLIKK